MENNLKSIALLKNRKKTKKKQKKTGVKERKNVTKAGAKRKLQTKKVCKRIRYEYTIKKTKRAGTKNYN